MLQTNNNKNIENNENNLQFLMENYNQQNEDDNFQDLAYPRSRGTSVVNTNNPYHKESIEENYQRSSASLQLQEDYVQEQQQEQEHEFVNPLYNQRQLSTRSYKFVQFNNEEEESNIIVETLQDEESDIQDMLVKKKREFQSSELEQQEDFERVSQKNQQDQEEVYQVLRKITFELNGDENDNKKEDQKEDYQEDQKEIEPEEQYKKQQFKLQDYEIEIENNEDPQILRKQIFNSILEEKNNVNKHIRRQSENFLKSMQMDLNDLIDYQKQSVLQRAGSSIYNEKLSLEQQIQQEQNEYFTMMVNDVKGNLKDIVSVIKGMKHQFISDEHDHQSTQDIFNMINGKSQIKAIRLPSLDMKNRKQSVESLSPGHQKQGELGRMSFGLERQSVKQVVQDELKEALLQQQKENELIPIVSDRSQIEELEMENQIQKQKLSQLNIDYESKEQGKIRKGFSFTNEINEIINKKKQSLEIEYIQKIPEEYISEFVQQNVENNNISRNQIVSEIVCKSINQPCQQQQQYKQNISAHDFIGLQQNEYAIKELAKKGEYINCNRIFSDYVTRINQRDHPEKRVLLITSKNLFNLNPNKNFIIERRIPLQKILKLQISEQKSTLFAIIVKDEYDYLFESFRRNEILMFLIETFKKNNWKLFQKEFTSQISIRNRGAQYEEQIEYKSLKLNGDLHEGLQNASKLGYLKMIASSPNKGWLSFLTPSMSKESFFVLTNIGLLGFHKSNDPSPFCLVPVIGCSLKAQVNPKQAQGNKWAFKLISAFTGQEFLFKAKSQREKQSWLNELMSVQIEGNKNNQQAQ